MTQRNYRVADCAEVYDLRALATIELGTAIRRSLAQSLVKQYAPPEEIPPALGDLLARLDKAKG